MSTGHRTQHRLAVKLAELAVNENAAHTDETVPGNVRGMHLHVIRQRNRCLQQRVKISEWGVVQNSVSLDITSALDTLQLHTAVQHETRKWCTRPCSKLNRVREDTVAHAPVDLVA